MMKRALLWLAFASILGLSSAQAREYSGVLYDRSSLGFVFKQMNVAVEGKFRKFTAQLAFDPAKPEAGRAQIEIDLASIDAGSEDANAEVRKRLWFDTANHPAARFVSTSVRALGGNRFEVSGKLTLKGRTREVSAPFTLRQEGDIARFEGGFILKRLEFGIGEGIWADTDTVADEVEIRFRIATSPGKK